MAVPGESPEMLPVLPIEATAGVALLQVPPATVDVAFTVLPWQMVAALLRLPASGSGLMLIACVVMSVPQELTTVYDTCSDPADKAKTAPVLVIVPIATSLTAHVPPAADELKAIDALSHTFDAPEIVPASGRAITVTSVVATSVPQPLVTV